MHYISCLMLSVTLVAACNSLAKKPPQNVSKTTKDIEVVLQPISSSVEDGVGCFKSLEEARINDATNLQHAQFLDPNTGWVASKESLFKTTNGGKTWQQLNVNIPAESSITSFFFTSKETGWLAVVSKIEEEGFSSRLLVTNDGGNTWTERQSFPNEVEVNVVRFQDAKTGFVAGSKTVKRGTLILEIFLTRTTDGGASWTDLSARINLTITNRFGVATGSVYDIVFTEPSRIHLLTGDGTVGVSLDAGKSWKKTAHFTDSRPQTGYRKLIVNAQQLSLLGGTISQEGIWGDVILSMANNAWVTYEIDNLGLFDAEFLSATEILMSGGAFRGSTDWSGSHYYGRKLPGVILRSFDNGKSWIEIYRGKTNQPIIELIKVGPTQIYAIGNDGAFLKFELQTCSAASKVAKVHYR